MKCSNCFYEIDPSENYCGNCGHPLKKNLITPLDLPNYARLKTKTSLNKPIYIWITSLMIAVATGLILAPIYMLLFAFIALIAATFISYHHHPKVKILSLSLSCLVILAFIGLLVFNSKKPTVNQINTASANQLSSNINTNCYSFQLKTIFNFTSPKNTCSIEAFNGRTINTSNQIIKIYAANNQTVTSQNFITFTKNALLQNIKKINLPIHIIKLQATVFDNNLANYIIFNEGSSTALMEFVYHPNNTDNLFLIFYGQNPVNDGITINNIIKNWQWKNY